MKNKQVVWSIIGVALLLLTVEFGGSAEASHKFVKVGGMKNHCDCTYRIE